MNLRPSVLETGTLPIELHSYYNLTSQVQNIGAGDGDRTHATSLEGWGSTTELHPLNLLHIDHLVEEVGFEPTYAYAGRFTVCCH